MAKQNDCWGIEVGANAIKAIRLVKVGNDLVVTDYDILPFKKVLTTPDLNVDEAIQVNLDLFLSRHNISKSTVMVSVPGHMAFARFAKLPPVDPKKIPDIVKFEAVQQIPFPIDQVEWDYQVFSQKDSPDVEVGIFAITKDRVMQFLANYRNVGMTIHGITLSPLAVYNAFAYDMDLGPDSDGVIFMDIGTASTDVIIVEHGQIWLRTLPIGGNNFTEALVRAFKLSFPKAEKLKREAATSKYARQIFQAMRPVFADLVQEMQRSLGYYQSLNRDAKLTKLVGVGSTFRLPGMQKFLKQQLQLEVERPSGFRRLRVDGKEEADFAENAMNLATAYGLAIQAMGLEAVNANLLPRHITRQRLWRAKQPWIAAAAVLMVVAAGTATVREWMEEKSYEAKYQDTADHITAVETRARGLVKDWQAVEGGSDPRQQIENLRRILDFRDVWPKFLVDLDLAALSLNPQPELLTSNYDAIRAIPRGDRKRIYVDSIGVEYQFQPDDGAAKNTPRATENLSWDLVFGLSRAQRPVGPAAAPEPGSRTPPSFVISIKGTTTYSEGHILLGEGPGHYITWLKQNAERKDRPYRIIVPNEPLVSIRRISATEAATIAAAAGLAPSTTAGADLPAHTTPMAMGPRRPGMGPAEPSIGGAAGAPKVEPALLPLPSAERLPQAGDWRFEVRWTIQLIRPDETREGELLDHEKPGNQRRPKPPNANESNSATPTAWVEKSEDHL